MKQHRRDELCHTSNFTIRTFGLRPGERTRTGLMMITAITTLSTTKHTTFIKLQPQQSRKLSTPFSFPLFALSCPLS
jgi:hypothetical protein